MEWENFIPMVKCDCGVYVQQPAVQCEACAGRKLGTIPEHIEEERHRNRAVFVDPCGKRRREEVQRRRDYVGIKKR